MIKEFAEVSNLSERLIHKYLPGALTLILPGIREINKEFWQGVRMPDYPMIVEISKRLDRPFTATSANNSNMPTPYSFEEFISSSSRESRELVDLFIDAGELNRDNLPSTIAKITGDDIEILSQGTLKLIDNY